MKKEKVYRIKVDTDNRPFIIDMDNGQTWHINQKVAHSANHQQFRIHSFNIEGNYSQNQQISIKDIDTFHSDMVALLCDNNGTTMGYANLKKLVQLESPVYSYTTDHNNALKQTENEYYLLIK